MKMQYCEGGQNYVNARCCNKKCGESLNTLCRKMQVSFYLGARR